MRIGLVIFATVTMAAAQSSAVATNGHISVGGSSPITSISPAGNLDDSFLNAAGPADLNPATLPGSTPPAPSAPSQPVGGPAPTDVATPVDIPIFNGLSPTGPAPGTVVLTTTDVDTISSNPGSTPPSTSPTGSNGTSPPGGFVTPALPNPGSNILNNGISPTGVVIQVPDGDTTPTTNFIMPLDFTQTYYNHNPVFTPQTPSPVLVHATPTRNKGGAQPFGKPIPQVNSLDYFNYIFQKFNDDVNEGGDPMEAFMNMVASMDYYFSQTHP